MTNFKVFLNRFFSAPNAIGAISPSSRFLVKELLHYYTKRDKLTPCKILEIGSGTGAITQQIIKDLGPDDQLDLVENDPKFTHYLKKTYPNPNVQLFQHSFFDFSSNKKYDYIICSLPFTSFDPFQVKVSFEKFANLSNQGIVSYLEYFLVLQLKYLITNRPELKLINSYKQNFYQKYPLKKAMVWLNIPPAKVYHQKISTLS